MIQLELRLVIIFVVIFLILYIAWLLWMAFHSFRSNKIKRELELERRKNDNLQSGVILAKDLLGAYINIVAKHGPDSMEAKSFLFGTESPMLESLHSDDKALEAFRQQVSIVNQTYHLIRR